MSTGYGQMLYSTTSMTRQKDLHNFTTKAAPKEASGWRLFGLYTYCLLLTALAVAFVTILVATPYLIWPP
jgi:hypothetical protein